MLDALLYRRFGDGIEGHTQGLLYRDPKSRSKMPRDSLTLAVRVGCRVDLRRVARILFYLIDYVRLAAYVDIVRLKVIINVDAEGAFRQIADMPV